MSLACECDVDCDWYYTAPEDFTELTTSKRQRCCSCRDLIDIGSISVTFSSWRNPRDEIEERIYGEGGEVPMANKYMCESCGDIYFNLTALDFCVNLGDSMKHLMLEYKEHYAPPKLSEENEYHGKPVKTYKDENPAEISESALSDLLADDYANLKHMTGCTSRYFKKDWGFRNYFAPDGKDIESMERLESVRYVTRGRKYHETNFFHATKAGCKAIRMKSMQIKNALRG